MSRNHFNTPLALPGTIPDGDEDPILAVTVPEDSIGDMVPDGRLQGTAGGPQIIRRVKEVWMTRETRVSTSAVDPDHPVVVGAVPGEGRGSTMVQQMQLVAVQEQPQHAHAGTEGTTSNHRAPPFNAPPALPGAVDVTDDEDPMLAVTVPQNGSGGMVQSRNDDVHGDPAGVSEVHVQQRIYLRIVDTIYISVPQVIEEGGAVPKVEPTCLDRCTDWTCQLFLCSFQSPFEALDAEVLRRARAERAMMTPLLQRGRAKGLEILQGLALPFVSDGVRAAWIIVELVTILLSFALSTASFSLGNNEVFNVIHLVLTILSTVLAILDAIVNLGNWRSCSCSRSCSERMNNTESCCGKCLARSKTAFDFVRMVLTELILYPLLICDIFDLAIEEGYKPGDSTTEIVGFVLFLISSIAMFFYVYILRLVILAYTIKAVQQHRTRVAESHRAKNSPFDDSSSKSGLWFQIHFFIHVFTQMVAQILMLVAIGAKIEYENRGNDGSIQVSNHLWYMIVAGYVLPVCGLLTFFMIAYYWTQEFTVGVCIDLLSILETPGVDHVFFTDERVEEGKNNLKKLANYVSHADLKCDYGTMHLKAWFHKFTYPMINPVIIILCAVYTALQLAFVISATYSVDPETNEMNRVVLNDGLGWTIYYIIATVIGTAINLYVMALSGFWIIVVILVILGLIIFVICFLIYKCLKSDVCKQCTDYLVEVLFDIICCDD